MVEHANGTNAAVSIFVVFVCLSSAGMASGLTQGLLSLDIMELRIKLQSGSDAEKKQAAAVLPLLSNHHVLLVSLLLWNASAMEILPLFLNKLVPEWVAIIMSVTLVLVMGEIVPAAVMTGPKQLQIASKLSSVVSVVLFVFYPLAFPIAKLLDYLLGHDEGVTTYSRSELSTMMKVQREEKIKRRLSQCQLHGEGGEEELVDMEEINMIHGVLHFGDIQVKDVMKTNIFTLSIDTVLDLSTLNQIFRSGYSRIPVFDRDKNDIIGTILSKDLLFIDPNDEIPLASFASIFLWPIQSVWPDQRLREVLRLFRLSYSHLAVVRDVNSDGPGDPFYEVKGIITLEDIFEQILGEDIGDEIDGLHTDGLPSNALASLRAKRDRDVDSIRSALLSHKASLSARNSSLRGFGTSLTPFARAKVVSSGDSALKSFSDIGSSNRDDTADISTFRFDVSDSAQSISSRCTSAFTSPSNRSASASPRASLSDTIAATTDDSMIPFPLSVDGSSTLSGAGAHHHHLQIQAQVTSPLHDMV